MTAKPLASVVIGGVVTSTLLTLMVLPTLYEVLERRILRHRAGLRPRLGIGGAKPTAREPRAERTANSALAIAVGATLAADVSINLEAPCGDHLRRIAPDAALARVLAQIRHELALTDSYRGAHERAETLFASVLETRLRTLGAEHPDLLLVRHVAGQRQDFGAHPLQQRANATPTLVGNGRVASEGERRSPQAGQANRAARLPHNAVLIDKSQTPRAGENSEACRDVEFSELVAPIYFARDNYEPLARGCR